ncbi:MAG: hypothetical protein D6820_08340, partial [Lentisphaerae bacterium]
MSRQIGLFMREDSRYIRDIIAGIQSYAPMGKDWRFHLFTPVAEVGRTLAQRGLDGVIAHFDSDALYESLEACSCPIISVGSLLEQPSCFRVVADDEIVGRRAAEYLLHTHAQAFAFVGYRDWYFSRVRHEAYARTIFKARRSDVPVFELEPQTGRSPAARDDRVDAELLAWLGRHKTRPLAVFCANDLLGMRVVNLCQAANLRVPHEILVLGVDNDPVYCSLCMPELSSIELPLKQIGFEAAALLDQLMLTNAGKSLSLPPVDVICRGSSELTRSRHPLVQ